MAFSMHGVYDDYMHSSGKKIGVIDRIEGVGFDESTSRNWVLRT
jgi:hypothetical protein